MDKEMLLQELIDKYRHQYWEFEELDLSDINQRCSDDDALIHFVARFGGPDEIELLVRSGAHVNAVGDMGYTPLHWAATEGRLEVVKRLLDLGADPYIKNEFDTTPIDCAERDGHRKAAHLLRQAAKYLKARRQD